MSSEISKNDTRTTGQLLTNDKIKTIPQMVHQEIVRSNTVINNSSSTMDFIRKKRKIKFNSDSRLSFGVTVLLELLTFSSIVFYRWMHVHFLKKSQTYFLCIWMENLITIAFSQLLFKVFNLPKYSCSKNLRSLCPLFLLNAIIIVAHGYDFVVFTRKSGGSEFYQFSMVLYLPMLFATMHYLCTFQLPTHVINIISVCTVFKIIFLFQDPEFSLSFTLCIASMFYAVIYAFYVICLKADLQKYTALELIYSLSLMALLIVPIFIIQREELSQGFNFKFIMVAILTGLLKLGTLYFTFVLLKQTDPVKTIVVLNAAFIPDHLMQALVYKLDCSMSTCKVCFFIVVDFILGHFKRHADVDAADEHLRYSLMK